MIILSSVGIRMSTMSLPVKAATTKLRNSYSSFTDIDASSFLGKLGIILGSMLD